ncbi:hypothetical protein OS493_006661 [Desmophyllum pertusum]|uniref:Ig-like domain-containing protein n=1 Tax=Desmophyllum pertusum TaxID=174260 RepID=A0A9W9ZRT3_9CNID|nr:hypothetical protein OS493_006661 [Desmophyllum pertusum]
MEKLSLINDKLVLLKILPECWFGHAQTSCPFPKEPTINSSEVIASTSSNVNLTCWIDSDDNCPEYLYWYLNDQQTPLENGEKYKEVLRNTHTKCKQEFILSIFNVTENDVGTYSCHWLCEYETTTKAAIDLKVSSEGKNIYHKGQLHCCQKSFLCWGISWKDFDNVLLLSYS